MISMSAIIALVLLCTCQQIRDSYQTSIGWAKHRLTTTTAHDNYHQDSNERQMQDTKADIANELQHWKHLLIKTNRHSDGQYDDGDTPSVWARSRNFKPTMKKWLLSTDTIAKSNVRSNNNHGISNHKRTKRDIEVQDPFELQHDLGTPDNDAQQSDNSETDDDEHDNDEANNNDNDGTTSAEVLDPYVNFPGDSRDSGPDAKFLDQKQRWLRSKLTASTHNDNSTTMTQHHRRRIERSRKIVKKDTHDVNDRDIDNHDFFAGLYDRLVDGTLVANILIDRPNASYQNDRGSVVDPNNGAGAAGAGADATADDEDEADGISIPIPVRRQPELIPDDEDEMRDNNDDQESRISDAHTSIAGNSPMKTGAGHSSTILTTRKLLPQSVEQQHTDDSKQSQSLKLSNLLRQLLPDLYGDENQQQQQEQQIFDDRIHLTRYSRK